MTKNTMGDLQEHLFDVIRGLKNNTNPKAKDDEKMDLDTAKAIANTAKVIIDSAKTEVDFLRVISKADNPNLTRERSKRLMLGSGEDEQDK